MNREGERINWVDLGQVAFQAQMAAVGLDDVDEGESEGSEAMDLDPMSLD